MRPILTLLRKDLLNFLHDRVALALTFVVPAVLIYIFGQVFGVTRTSSGPTGILLAIVDQTGGTAAPRAITDALTKEKAFRVITTDKGADGVESPLTEARVRAMFRENRLRFAIVFPSDAQTDSSFGLKLRFLNNPRNDIETQTVTGLLQKVVFTAAPAALFDSLRKQSVAFIGEPSTRAFYRSLADSVARAFGGDADRIFDDMMDGRLPSAPTGPTSTAAAASAEPATPSPFAGFVDRIVRIEPEQLAGQQVKNAAATRSVGGWAIMFLLFSVSGAATSLFDEKKAGLFLRLLAAPVRRSHILWSKYLFCMGLGLVQLTSLFFAGRLLFGIDVTSNFGNLLLICFAASAACTAFGMLLAAIARSPAAASGLATFLVLTMSAVGGAWFPTSFMPEFMQTLSKLTIVYWSMEGFVQVLWADCTFLELLPTLGVLLGIAVVVNAISIWRFNRGDLFD
jgi:ABC-2 type transport system permease protein